MADAIQFEFPVSGSKEKSSGKIIGNIEIENKDVEQGPESDLPEFLGETTPAHYTLEEYYKED